MSEESPNTRISPQTQPSLHEQIADAVRTVRETTPLAQSFTNFVTINLVANAQLAATSLYNTAGEIAEKRSNGPGSFQVALLDALWNVTAEEVADRAIDMR